MFKYDLMFCFPWFCTCSYQTIFKCTKTLDFNSRREYHTSKCIFKTNGAKHLYTMCRKCLNMICVNIKNAYAE